jgi:hypothetical protein
MIKLGKTSWNSSWFGKKMFSYILKYGRGLDWASLTTNDNKKFEEIINYYTESKIFVRFFIKSVS